MLSVKHPNGVELGASLRSLETNTASTIELTGYNSSKSIEAGEDDDISFVKQHPTSDLEAFLHVVKSSLGTGVLAIADGFKHAGMVIGLLGTIIVGVLCAHCTYIMVNCSQGMCELLNKPFLGYTETVETSLLYCANKRFSHYAGFVKKIAEGFMFFTYYGVNTVYILLVAETLSEIMEHHYQLHFNIRVYILMTAVPVFLVGIVRNMKYLVPFSAVANVLLFTGLCLTFYFLFQDLPEVSSRPNFAPISKLPLFFSTVLFGMEGIGTMLPIENSMKKPQHFLGCPGVLTVAMSVVVTMFMMVGFFGFLKYGDDAKGSITLNLPEDGLAEAVKALVALANLFSYGLQLTASMDVVWKRVECRFPEESQGKAYYIVRTLMIFGTILLAIAVPNLAPVISLIGAVGFSMCGFFFPALVETIMLWEAGFGRFHWKLWKNIMLVLVTIVAVISGSFTSIIDIIDQYS
ncbi:proton-coupled amino acid transporter-like protein pathetic [Cimex lectularius]|uniref:Amino acid transporter transmembrane domain-containing protein n=1 Tax=Cimex lectularius TaxID=79782 RepID=A0A8I6RCK8_CIMLE|nr:proton-coupled amino acid transporter-like protein pathetic [Cimex lectularius]XP_014241282.1 proton-coupled amino acid transporter-like protein pathetic [Cimex lectularius]